MTRITFVFVLGEMEVYLVVESKATSGLPAIPVPVVDEQWPESLGNDETFCWRNGALSTQHYLWSLFGMWPCRSPQSLRFNACDNVGKGSILVFPQNFNYMPILEHRSPGN